MTVPPTHARRQLRRCLVVALSLVIVPMMLQARPAMSRPAAVDCGGSPPANGTGYHPPPNADSLPARPQRPGPEILYRPLATAPQLENAGAWRATPILISGASAYRSGEFVYQDFLYDDRALSYPDEPETYADNAADFVEIRLKPLNHSLAIRITYNSMLDPNVVATTIALGDSTAPLPMPHDAGAATPAEVFITVHGCSGDIVRAADGAPLAITPTVATDLARRQVHVEVPYGAFDPRGQTAVRVGAATGLWDSAAGRYRRPGPARPAFFNVAFRDQGPWTVNTWKDESQNAALASGDLSSLSAVVDFTKLAAGVDDDMIGQPRGVPRSGPMNRIVVSHFEDAQGRGNYSGLYSPCDPPGCTYAFAGRLQPYAVYVPDRPPPPGGYGLVLTLHGSSSNHNHFELGGPEPELLMWQILAEGGRPSVVVSPNARGPNHGYRGAAAADVFEVWADAAAHHRLDPRFVVLSGSSMGGYGTYKFGTQYPDLYGALFPNVGPSSLPNVDPDNPLAGDVLPLFPNLRHVSILATNGANDPLVNAALTTRHAHTLDELGYRHDFWFFTSVAGLGGHAEYRHFVRSQYQRLSDDLRRADADPGHVTYVLDPRLDEPAFGLVADHVYWVGDLRRRDTAASALPGTIDVISHGFGLDDADAPPADQSSGASVDGSGPYIRQRREWTAAREQPTGNRLTISASNVSEMTIDVDRARVQCDAALDVTSDGPLTINMVGADCRRVAISPATAALTGPTAPADRLPTTASPAGGVLPATGANGGLPLPGLVWLALAGLVRCMNRSRQP